MSSSMLNKINLTSLQRGSEIQEVKQSKADSFKEFPEKTDRERGSWRNWDGRYSGCLTAYGNVAIKRQREGGGRAADAEKKGQLLEWYF